MWLPPPCSRVRLDAPRGVETLRRWTLWPAWLATAALALVFLAGASVPMRLQYLPLLASAVLFGIPHGAVDHLVVPRLRGTAPRPGLLLRIAGGYLLLAVAAAALWWVAPAAAFAGFIALTWFHWGQGDLYTLLALEGALHLRTRAQRALVVVVRGGLPMLVPFLAFPSLYREGAEALVALFRPEALGTLAWAWNPGFRWLMGAGFGALAVLGLALGLGRAPPGDHAAWRRDAAETLLLAVFFATVPPTLAIGTYFCLWHSPRHIARLLVLEPGGATGLRGGGVVVALGRFARDAAPLSAAALGLLALFAFSVPHTPGTLAASAALYLVGLSALTVPHTAVVVWMDRRQGVWKVH